MDNAGVKNRDKRLLGYVRFFDIDKGFGFIDTNGLGIDATNSDQPSKSIELFFGSRDCYGTFIDNEWVSFVYKKASGKKRDYANYVRTLRYNEEELSLAMQYSGIYAKMIIGESQSEVKVIASYLSNYLKNRREQSRLICQLLLDSYTKQPQDTLDTLIKEQNLMNALLSYSVAPEDNNSNVFEEVVYKLTLIVFDDVLRVQLDHNLKYFEGRVRNLEQCVRRLRREDLILFRDMICSYYNTPPNQYSYIHYHLDTLLNTITLDSLRDLFGNGDYNSPMIRSLVYSRLGDATVLMHSTMVEYWNKQVLLIEEDGIYSVYSVPKDKKRYHLSITIPNSVSTYIATSNANDYLLLATFLETSNVDCFNRVKDKALITSWLPKLNDNYIFRFIELRDCVPQELMSNFFLKIGPARLSKVAMGRDTSFVNLVPNSMKVSLYVVLELHKEEQITEESDWYGGYWTWGEGMKHQKYDIYTYLARDYYTTVYVCSDCNESMVAELSNNDKLIIDHIRTLVESKNTIAVFSCPENGDDLLVYLDIGGFNQSNCMKLFARPMTAKLMINTQTVIDD